MLREMVEQDVTVANLFFRTMMEEVPDMAMVEDVLQQDMFERLRELQAFRDYEARVVASAEASADARLKSEAEARLKSETAEAESRGAVKAKADALTQFFFLRGDRLSEYAFSQINGCKDVSKLSYWLNRAYTGEAPEDIFPEPGTPRR